MPWSIGGSFHGLGFKLFHEEVSYNGANGETHGCAIDLFTILALEEEVIIYQAEFQQRCGILYEHGGPTV